MRNNHRFFMKRETAHGGNSDIERVRGLLIESEGFLSDPRAGEAANELAERIIAALNPEGQEIAGEQE